MYQFADDYGIHRHEVSQPGRAYDPSVPITCTACQNRLTHKLNLWLDKLTKRENLPENFWVGYKAFPWWD